MSAQEIKIIDRKQGGERKTFRDEVINVERVCHFVESDQRFS